MAKKKAVRRENGRGTVEKTNSKKNPFKAKVPVGTKVDKNGKTQAIYKTLGTFPTREEAELALMDFSRTPYELTSTVKTFADLYEVWSKYYFSTLKGESSMRTVTSAYAYCSGLYDMSIRNIGPGHIKDAMEQGYVIPTMGKDKGKKRYASINTKERIKSMCNLMFDYAVERRLLLSNPARAFKIGNLLEEIQKKSKGKIPFTQEQVNELWKYVDDIAFVDMLLIAMYTGQVKRCGMDSGIRKRIMGHSLNGDVTESVYTHPTFEDLVHEMNKLDFSVREYV